MRTFAWLLLCLATASACVETCGEYHRFHKKYTLCNPETNTEVCTTQTRSYLRRGYVCGPCVSTSFTCPPPGKGQQLRGYREGTEITLKRSESGSLCGLYLVTRRGMILPIGRSYEGHEWESYAGVYARHTFICDSNECTTVLPRVSRFLQLRYGRYRYKVQSFAAETHEGARLLEQTTFGPTMTDIDKLGDTTSPASWIQMQMQLPLTSHRKFYRERVRHRFPGPSVMGVVTRPCDEGTMYRRAAFSDKDWSSKVTIKTVSTGLKSLSVNGIVRTFLQVEKITTEDGKKTFVDGDYEVCDRIVHLQDSSFRLQIGSDCTEMWANGTEVGIPTVYFPPENLPENVILLDGHAKLVNGEYYSGGIAQELYVQSNVEDGKCRNFPEVTGLSEIQVFGLFAGEYWIHDPRFVLRDNTVASPMMNGGGDLVAATQTVEDPRDQTLCASAPRTLFNQESCVLSTEPGACGQAVGSVQSTIELIEANFERVYEASGGTKFIYTVTGLRNDEADVPYEPPCHASVTSRWRRLGTMTETKCFHRTLEVHNDTRAAIAQILMASGDENPNTRDIFFPETPGISCHADDMDTKDFRVYADGECFENVHRDSYSVFDFTEWASEGGHNGGADKIQQFALTNFSLAYPYWHEMERWHRQEARDQRIELGRLGDTIDLNESPHIRTAFQDIIVDEELVGAAVVCGSPNEVASIPDLHVSSLQGGFDSFTTKTTTDGFRMKMQRLSVWTRAALEAKDQLRQRVAWILSQLLVISPTKDRTEYYLHYYDIFVRHAFGNYRDILREVAFSPAMGTMLTYLNGQSTAYIFKRYTRLEFADENFAREIMQLFTIGLVELGIDGIPKRSSAGQMIQTYNNDDITEYARLWTGFFKQNSRGNIEDDSNKRRGNNLDPMRINRATHDQYPKMGLNGHYVADGLPLCVDLPDKHFLAKGATYHLLGSSPLSNYVVEPAEWLTAENVNRLQLAPTSKLFEHICNRGNDGNCRYRSVVRLSMNIQCTDTECKITAPRVIEVEPGLFYEYVSPPCATFAYPVNAQLMKTHRNVVSCGDPKQAVASVMCCVDDKEADPSPSFFTEERMTFLEAQSRCSAVGKTLCERSRFRCRNNHGCDDSVPQWISQACVLQAKIDGTGRVGIVHSSNDAHIKENNWMDPYVNEETKTFFRVSWSSQAQVDMLLQSCESVGCGRDPFDNMCLCNVTSSETRVFDTMPSREAVLSQLHYGGFDLRSFGVAVESQDSGDGVVLHFVDEPFSISSVFEVVDDYGVTRFFRNFASKVAISDTLSFRNPTHTMSLTYPDLRDAEVEILSGLDHLIVSLQTQRPTSLTYYIKYHPNTAPFLATHFIRRFGISNPSPGYVKRVAEAFKNGFFEQDEQTFGDENYGNLGAMTAAVLLDREARSRVLDADPFHGSFQEPLLKVIRMMRSLKYKGDDDFPLVRYGTDLVDSIGQQAHSFPSVFSFFLPEYAPAGALNDAGMVCPECQVLVGPKVVTTLNGLVSFLKYGFDSRFSGFGIGRGGGDRDRAIGSTEYAKGSLLYEPNDSLTTKQVIDELSLLLTSDRLSERKRSHLVDVFNSIEEDKSRKEAIIAVESLILSTPEFQTNVQADNSGPLVSIEYPDEVAGANYKAVVFVMLVGGADSYNMLVPHSCSGTNAEGKGILDQYNQERGELAMSASERTHVIEADNQPCQQFALHEELGVLKNLYNSGDLAFFANTGIIEDSEMTKSTYKSRQRNVQLFAHNFMQRECAVIDPTEAVPDTGVLGRMSMTLRTKGFKTEAFSIEDPSIMLDEEPLVNKKESVVVSRNGPEEFDRKPSSEDFDLEKEIFELNREAFKWSPTVGKVWSNVLLHGIKQSKRLKTILDKTSLELAWPNEFDAKSFRTVAELLQTRVDRGAERDTFHIRLGGWDHHADMKENLKSRLSSLSESIELFTAELKAQGLWESVTVVVGSEFGRTITGNGGQGSDHAWGGHYMMMGGSVAGGKIHGKYPDDITPIGPLNIGRGRMLPTTSWDAIWNGVAEWMGLEADAELDYCLPNRIKSTVAEGFTDLMTKDDLFKQPSGRRNLRLTEVEVFPMDTPETDSYDDWYADFNPADFEPDVMDFSEPTSNYLGGGRGGGGRKNRSNNRNNGGYTRDTSRDNSNINEVAVLELIEARALARQDRDFDRADDIRDQLLEDHGVRIFDKTKEWRSGCSPGGSGSDFGRDRSGGGSFGRERNGDRDRHGGRERRASRPPTDFGPKGHDYELCPDAGPNQSGMLEQEIDARIAERLQCKLNRQFRRADQIQEELQRVGVYVNDKGRQWRADGELFSVKRQPEDVFFTQSEYSLPVDEDEVKRMQELVDERAAAKQNRDFVLADKLEAQLHAMNVGLNNDLREWSVGNSFGERRKQHLEGGSSVRRSGGNFPYIRSLHSLSMDDDSVAEVQQEVDRFVAARAEQDYREADRIREQLRENKIFLDSSACEWSLGGYFGEERRAALEYKQSRGSKSVAPEDVNIIEALLMDRLEARRLREFDVADSIRDKLHEQYCVDVDDRKTSWFAFKSIGKHSVQTGEGSWPENSLGESSSVTDLGEDELDDIMNEFLSRPGNSLDDYGDEPVQISDNEEVTLDEVSDSFDEEFDSSVDDIVEEVLSRQDDSLDGFGGDEVEIAEESAGEDLSSLTVPELKERLKQAGKPVSGRKAELIERLQTDA